MRDLIVAQLDEQVRILEVGCGTGDLLFRASHRIEYGFGVDLDHRMIAFAAARMQKEKHPNLRFENQDITALTDSLGQNFDVATSTLCLHEMREQDAITTLKLLTRVASKLIIADYGAPKTQWGKASIELDELISGHYRRFAHYRSAGGMPNLARLAGLHLHAEIETPIDGIYIWILNGTEDRELTEPE
ncbi:MAG: class I SAM-dependent methyltransferase [Gammaproteobacteria bacterium]